ncbi:MAG: tRNA glutamyl-Q(34) synthetase GluQRS [Negativicutes bacterium]|nr:tRNA glutamyl-Q(34) synthetase GluQRS [Negativicutes bacterium]
MRGRFAPSPTGELHLGSAWTALLAWLQVRAAKGIMVLRIEDIDPNRSRAAYTEALMADLKWLGLEWDEGPEKGGPYGPYFQSQRRELYQETLRQLAAAGLIYPCYCTRGELAASAPHGTEGERVYPGTCCSRTDGKRTGKEPALRLVVPPGCVAFYDGVRGRFVQDVAREVGDFIVRRADGVHAYQLAVVVDDAAMRITHVLRGADLLDSTPRQLVLYRLLGHAPPEFAHVPLLIAEDGHRLSKRQRDLSLAALRQQGARPENIIGYLAWKAGLMERFAPVAAADLIPGFSIKRIGTGPVVIGADAVRLSGAR